jgi:hypothetical protein
MPTKPLGATANVDCEPLKKLIREVPDFPKKGILFYDITTLLKDKLGFAALIDALAEHYIQHNIDLILGMEARGFIFGPALAARPAAPRASATAARPVVPLCPGPRPLRCYRHYYAPIRRCPGYAPRALQTSESRHLAPVREQ